MNQWTNENQCTHTQTFFFVRSPLENELRSNNGSATHSASNAVRLIALSSGRLAFTLLLRSPCRSPRFPFSCCTDLLLRCGDESRIHGKPQVCQDLHEGLSISGSVQRGQDGDEGDNGPIDHNLDGATAFLLGSFRDYLLYEG